MGIIDEIGNLAKERDLWKSKYYELLGLILPEIKMNPISGEELTEYFFKCPRCGVKMCRCEQPQQMKGR